MGNELNNFGIIPKASSEQVRSRASQDRECYIAGKDAAKQELSRDTDVQYKDKRDRDCFNMGYSSITGGEI